MVTKKIAKTDVRAAYGKNVFSDLNYFWLGLEKDDTDNEPKFYLYGQKEHATRRIKLCRVYSKRKLARMTGIGV